MKWLFPELVMRERFWKNKRRLPIGLVSPSLVLQALNWPL